MAEKPLNTNLDASEVTLAARIRNLIVVTVGAVLSVLIVLALQTQGTTASLSSLANGSVPLEEALANDQPSFVEFYADWCTSCQAMAGDMAALREEYGDRVNFVMLNVDNSKWLPEMGRYEVDGIPHFVFLDQAGEAIAQTIGEQPRTIVAANLEALLAGRPLPYNRQAGRTSEVRSGATLDSQGDDPRRHGAQVQD
ncbi:MAG: thioredoxin family protein [Phormidium sp. BM_Day4_Bin.17]|nr:thioredoxin family protein [Phormidium sp. BM_Day4_Bin.17]UCJ11773.1 MAG: thioredoxin family protein [Phormidium sp. PBR-2020]